MRLQLQVLLQALEDILNYELGLPLVGEDGPGDREDLYEDALAYVSRYPYLVKRLQTYDKRRWLKEIQELTC